MTWPDLVNAGFELVGGAVLWLTVLATYRAKCVVGVAIPTVLFFVGWDVWFLFFYASLGQWASFAAGLWLTAAQATWLGQMVYYLSRRECGDCAYNPGLCDTHDA
jgi:hypothetical protein